MAFHNSAWVSNCVLTTVKPTLPLAAGVDPESRRRNTPPRAAHRRAVFGDAGGFLLLECSGPSITTHF
ncbi:hypothetical protein RB213_008389 [Colletotrichum asianum]